MRGTGADRLVVAMTPGNAGRATGRVIRLVWWSTVRMLDVLDRCRFEIRLDGELDGVAESVAEGRR